MKLYPEDDQRFLLTAQFLREKNSIDGAFFQDMIHSGLNAYLTLHIAQVMLRAGDLAALELIETVSQLASPTGQWPEAIHPRTLGGCMGDGHHGWASAEWVLAMKALFLREEGGQLLLLPGISEQWLQPGERLSFGPTATDFGPLRITAEVAAKQIEVSWEAQWSIAPEHICISLPGHERVRLDAHARQWTIQRS